MVNLSNILEIVERSLYKTLEAVCISSGYTPDKSLFTDDDTGKLAYQIAIESIITIKGFSVALFGVGSSHKKYYKTVPRIVIIERKFLPGDLGGSPDPQYELNLGNFDGNVQPPQTSDYHFQVNLCYKTAAQKRILEAILAATFNNRSYIKFYTDVTKQFFIERYNSTIIEDNDMGIKENAYLYQAKDIWESEDVTIQTGIKPIVEITLDVTVNNQQTDTETITP